MFVLNECFFKLWSMFVVVIVIINQGKATSVIVDIIVIDLL